ncbi:ankyrin repeat domain-containing protein 50-like [Haliotis rufescens]|uniref:ankyrin repeat domain-containing protein 50-like n=1 Tax=Haliotis rufescens TaxID=6454 RepID=UPI00201F4CB4|nr:ankyrin repeat domain-containing protein 50-like [Haliotis rufescens]
MPRCLSSSLQLAIYFMLVLSTYRTNGQCELQMTGKLKIRSVTFRNIDFKLCQLECIQDSFVFASCRQSIDESKEKTGVPSGRPKSHPHVQTNPCGYEVCNLTSRSVMVGCENVCLEVPSSCDLHSASEEGDLSRVEVILSQGGTDINCKDKIGRTPVMWAAGNGHKEVVELLVSKGAKVSIVDRFGNNILHSAGRGGDVEVVQYVLSHDMVDINGRGSCRRTPVMLAAEKGHIEIVKLLVDKGGDMSLVDKGHENILHLACLCGQIEVVKYVLSQDIVDINCRGRKTKTPVMLAARNGHKEVVEILVKKGADLSLAYNAAGSNVLHLACFNGHVDVVKYLLSQGTVNINSRGWRKRTPVMRAAGNGQKEVVELLVKQGADLSLAYNTAGSNVLHLACFKGHVDVVKYLLSQDIVDINSRGLKKRTPVMLAAEKGHKEVVELLVNKGADASLVDNRGNNILHLACLMGQMEVVKYIVSKVIVDVNAKNKKRKTAANIASSQGRGDLMDLLVSHGAHTS